MALGPVRLVTEQRPPSCPQEAWTEKRMVLQASRPCWGTDEVCEMQVPLGSGEGPSASDTSPQQENPMSFIRACCTHRPQHLYLPSPPQAEEEKLRFLSSIRAVFEAAIKDRGAHYRLCVCPLEVAQCIEALLQEEPTEFLDTELRQQAMSVIAAMSSAGLLPEERKSGLLRACLGSILHLPHQEDMKHWDAAVYMETMEALHHLLQVLVGSAGASVLLELQNILELLLPFTTCQLMATEERAVACIARLLTFSNTCSLPEVCSCFTGAVVLRHQCTENQRFPVLGKLTGHLILCCTSSDEGTRDEAMKAVRQLFIFIASQRMWLWQKDPKKPQLRERWQTLFYEQISQENNASKIFKVRRPNPEPTGELRPAVSGRVQLLSLSSSGDESSLLSFLPQMFLKYLLYPEKVDVFLTAIESMTEPRLHSTELAAHMVDVLAAEAHFPPGQVGTCCCHSSSPLGSAPSLDLALRLAGRQQWGWQQGPALVPSHSHMWPLQVQKMVKMIYSSLPSIKAEPALESLGRALLVLASKHPREVVRSLLGCSPTCTRWDGNLGDGRRMLFKCFLQAARTIPELFQLPLVLKEAEAIFPQLFLALLLQVSFTLELTLQEVGIFWEEHQQNQLTPIRSAVRSLKVLLCSVGLQRQMEAIQEQGGWDVLLSTVTHLQGVQAVARVMRELPRALRVPIFHQLVELLSTKLCSGEMVAMIFLVEMLECADLGEELHCVVSVFSTHLQSQSVGTQQLVLRGVLQLSKRQDTARKMIGLLPCIMKQLQDADSGARAVALPV
ncbi:hypothetical protein ASZ78_006917, partial [Callipepla squamata]